MRLYSSTGFFFLAWAMHYLPFYIMGRQLFLHHYLPAHLASTLVTGALLEFIFSARPVDDFPEEDKKRSLAKNKPARMKLPNQDLSSSWIALTVILILVIGSWYFFLPLTYGYPGLSVKQVQSRKWLSYDLHFAK